MLTNRDRGLQVFTEEQTESRSPGERCRADSVSALAEDSCQGLLKTGEARFLTQGLQFVTGNHCQAFSKKMLYLNDADL